MSRNTPPSLSLNGSGLAVPAANANATRIDRMTQAGRAQFWAQVQQACITQMCAVRTVPETTPPEIVTRASFLANVALADFEAKFPGVFVPIT